MVCWLVKNCFFQRFEACQISGPKFKSFQSKIFWVPELTNPPSTSHSIITKNHLPTLPPSLLDIYFIHSQFSQNYPLIIITCRIFYTFNWVNLWFHAWGAYYSIPLPSLIFLCFSSVLFSFIWYFIFRLFSFLVDMKRFCTLISYVMNLVVLFASC